MQLVPKRTKYEFLGWPVSPYSMKTGAYLRFKRIPFRDRQPSILELNTRIKRAVGHPIMPTVVTPEGTWWQDSTDIIDSLKSRFPEPSITPPGPRQVLTSFLVELFADEWLPQVALHYRWNLDENRHFAMSEFGRLGLPGLPLSVSRRIVDRMAGSRMRSYLPLVGVDERTIEGIERATKELLESLDIHFGHHAYLLGDRPCLGDFALFGQLWAHLYRDVATTRLFDEHERLRRWILAMENPSPRPGTFLEGDLVPDTLEPLLRAIFEEALPFFVQVEAAVADYRAQHPAKSRPPRRLGEAGFSVGGVAGTRSMLSYAQWMLQRPLLHYQGLDSSDRSLVNRWLEPIGDPSLLQTEIRCPLQKENFKYVYRDPEEIENHPSRRTG